MSTVCRCCSYSRMRSDATCMRTRTTVLACGAVALLVLTASGCAGPADSHPTPSLQCPQDPVATPPPPVLWQGASDVYVCWGGTIVFEVDAATSRVKSDNPSVVSASSSPQTVAGAERLVATAENVGETIVTVVEKRPGEIFESSMIVTVLSPLTNSDRQK